jgi:hypothetical protein
VVLRPIAPQPPSWAEPALGPQLSQDAGKKTLVLDLGARCSCRGRGGWADGRLLPLRARCFRPAPVAERRADAALALVHHHRCALPLMVSPLLPLQTRRWCTRRSSRCRSPITSSPWR